MENNNADATFVVHVSSVENNTWQGQVTWADTGEKANFRSVLELMNLMDKAVKTDISDIK